MPAAVKPSYAGANDWDFEGELEGDACRQIVDEAHRSLAWFMPWMPRPKSNRDGCWVVCGYRSVVKAVKPVIWIRPWFGALVTLNSRWQGQGAPEWGARD
jgi:hypothetical protein